MKSKNYKTKKIKDKIEKEKKYGFSYDKNILQVKS